MDFYELLLITLVALFVLKPEDVPDALYQLGKALGKARFLILEWQAKGRDLMEAKEIQEYQEKALKEAKDHDRTPSSES